MDEWYEARDRMVEAVIADLMGSEEDATLTEPPLDRYIVGILHPRSRNKQQEAALFADEDPDDASGSAQDAPDDPGVSIANVRYPSSAGLTVGVSAGTSRLSFEIRADRYLPDSSRESLQESDVQTRSSKKRPSAWRIFPFRRDAVVLDLETGTRTIGLEDGLELNIVVRAARDGVHSVTATLVNRFVKPERGTSDEWCWFRPFIGVTTEGGQFADRRPDAVLAHMDLDERSGELLYRSERNLAVGHGVGVIWNESAHVTRVETTFFPSHDLPLAKADIDAVGPLLMDDIDQPLQLAPLSSLVDEYEAWVVKRRLQLETESLNEGLFQSALQNLDNADAAVARMRRGIEILRTERLPEQAFRVMNAAMRTQRLRQEMIRNGLEEPPQTMTPEWRPFQIAFILISIEGIANPTSAERDLADLLWFPTGGGKTEAYLGLIAFTLALRRLRGDGVDGDGAGVGVLMRYTLRLLTLQQFERASGLICSLESLRRSNPDLLAAAPFSIGLWVGQGATPNNVKNAAKALRKIRSGEDPGDLGDPMQLLRCPWCGSGLGADDYAADQIKDQLTITCPNRSCEFATGLPVHLVDTDVYSARPSLVIGTVDKFAMLAWNGRSGALFGLGHDAAPDLIIQDELHLISGPLGTLVGLYETAVDHLATDALDGSRPKLIASTATIRRASHQVRSVFAREARQFPPPGIDAGDSFFAVDAKATEKGTRRYVGLMSGSASHSTLLVRTYAAALQAALDLDVPPEVRDAYWTLLGYFNSLRVLGAAFIQSIDDVKDRIVVVASRNGTSPRSTTSPSELTSRVKSSDIPRQLMYLAKSFPDVDSPDVVLATNMISVGVDIDRLALMAVMGQPQTTSEYIQATSRVGRRHPGLVFTMYNSARSRDLSHYENFTSYHRALYKHVEATGATPFAARALDRGLHGLLVALARHSVAGASGDIDVAVPVSSEAIERIADVIVSRVRSSSTGDEDIEAVESQVREALGRLVEDWSDGVESNEIKRYAKWDPQVGRPDSLMIPAGSEGVFNGEDESLASAFPPSGTPWPTLTSLRNVDRESTLRIINGRRDSGARRNAD
ncbi:helicase-related protein [Leifsonia sp. EB34]|uniref:helicase-related protein n=1 Tax=Leifsonia sp. EB34 TaxID=3156303 RepID=UPI0035187CEC